MSNVSKYKKKWLAFHCNKDQVIRSKHINKRKVSVNEHFRHRNERNFQPMKINITIDQGL